LMNSTASPTRKTYYRCTHGAQACHTKHRTAKAALACCPEYRDMAAIKRVTSYPEHDNIVTTFYRRAAYMPGGWAIDH
uniref:hypothetical protein n=1 Tax=Candidatus Poriferisocius sp. TaxID=3101276 RepID=UPI003B52C4FC